MSKSEQDLFELTNAICDAEIQEAIGIAKLIDEESTTNPTAKQDSRKDNDNREIGWDGKTREERWNSLSDFEKCVYQRTGWNHLGDQILNRHEEICLARERKAIVDFAKNLLDCLTVEGVIYTHAKLNAIITENQEVK
jgi:hypothetical protein